MYVGGDCKGLTAQRGPVARRSRCVSRVCRVGLVTVLVLSCSFALALTAGATNKPLSQWVRHDRHSVSRVTNDLLAFGKHPSIHTCDALAKVVRTARTATSPPHDGTQWRRALRDFAGASRSCTHLQRAPHKWARANRAWGRFIGYLATHGITLGKRLQRKALGGSRTNSSPTTTAPPTTTTRPPPTTTAPPPPTTTTAPPSYVVATGHASGTYALATVTGTAPTPTSISLRLTASPPLSALVSWFLLCRERGGGVGEKHGESTLSLPTTEMLPLPGPSSTCSVSADAELQGGGTLTISIIDTK